MQFKGKEDKTQCNLKTMQSSIATVHRLTIEDRVLLYYIYIELKTLFLYVSTQ